MMLAWARDPGSLPTPLDSRYDYLSAVPAVDDLGDFLRGFVDAVPALPTHVKSHPPGAVVVLWLLDRAGLGGSAWAAAFVLAIAASGVAAVLIALRATATEGDARRAAPFLAVLPAAVWIATSMDALFAAAVAWAVAATALARSKRGLIGAGVCWGMALLLTYGAAPLLLVAAAVADRRRDLAWVAGGTAATLTVAALAGFCWPSGLAAAREAYLAGIAPHRSYGWFLLLGAAAFAVAVGPAVFVGLASPPRIAAAAGAALVVAAVSGMSKGEVERIWLPFALLIAASTAAVPLTRMRTLLGVQCAIGIVLAAALSSPW